MAIDQQGLTPPETEAPMTIAGCNTVLLSVAATLCGLFTVLALSVRQIRNEARQTLLQALRLVGFSFGYLVIGLVYVPIRVLDCASRAWPSSSSESACDCDFDDYYCYYSDGEEEEEEGDEDGGCANIRSSRRKVWLVDKKGGDDAARYSYYENEPCSTTRRDMLLAGGGGGEGGGGGGRHYTAAASSSHYTRCNSDISDLDLNEASDLEKGVLPAWRNKTKPC
ncbi:hypothetical protein PG985_000729 [Apiospora marii]|uniref:G-protein coupled receptors family 3 profile domain-containing protein n=1 Tax=Apiospora marii TaxID=335849 RepID=A0ABR1R3P2_9PEZI